MWRVAARLLGGEVEGAPPARVFHAHVRPPRQQQLHQLPRAREARGVQRGEAVHRGGRVHERALVERRARARQVALHRSQVQPLLCHRAADAATAPDTSAVSRSRRFFDH